MMRFLIDECLSPRLVKLVVEAGYPESTCIRDRGLLGKKDWELMDFIISEDFTLVTHNSEDFRGEGASAPGGLYAEQLIHAGLICLNSPHSMDIPRQQRLLEVALRELEEELDLVNQALDVFESEDGEVSVFIYNIPASL